MEGINSFKLKDQAIDDISQTIVKKHNTILKQRGYNNIQFLGQGQQGFVYGAEKKGQTFAIKMIKIREDGQELKQKKEAENEINCLNKFNNNPYVIRLLSIFEEEDYMCLCFPKCKMTLTQLIESEKLSEKNVLKISKDLVEGLSYIQSVDNKFILGDIKPDNILIDYNMNAIMADFGLGKQLQSNATHSVNPVGNYLYCAPEMIQGIIKCESAIYSLGLVIYELIVGHKKIIDHLAFKGRQLDLVIPDSYKYKNELEYIISGFTQLEPKQRLKIDIAKYILKGICCEISCNTKQYEENQANQDMFTSYYTQSTCSNISNSSRKDSYNSNNNNQLNISQLLSSNISNFNQNLSDLNLPKFNSQSDTSDQSGSYQSQSKDIDSFLCQTELNEDKLYIKDIKESIQLKKSIKRKFLERANFYLEKIINAKQKQGTEINIDDLISSLIEKKKTHFLIRFKEKADSSGTFEDIQFKILSHPTDKNKNNTKSTIINEEKYLKAQQLYQFVTEIQKLYKR